MILCVENIFRLNEKKLKSHFRAEFKVLKKTFSMKFYLSLIYQY